MSRLIGLAGMLVFLGICYLLSSARRRISWRTLWVGILLQVVIAWFMLKTSLGLAIFDIVNRAFVGLVNYSNHGARFLFGKLVDSQEMGAVMAFQVLPVIIFVSALMGLLVHLGVIGWIIRGLAFLFQKTMKITGVEAFVSALQIFMGIEGITGVKGYIANMNASQIFVVMVTYMGTIAGSVMAAYTNFGVQAGHLMTASLISAPGAIVIAKLLVPDEDRQSCFTLDRVRLEKPGRNIIDSLATGASDGISLAIQIGGMLIAFISIIYLLDDIVRLSGKSMVEWLGYAFSPFAVLIGIPIHEARTVGELLGIKTIFTEFISYMKLQTHILHHTLSPRTIAITTYALCGFTHFGSVAILIASIGTLVPSQKSLVAKLAMKCLLAGFLTTMMTAAVSSLFL